MAGSGERAETNSRKYDGSCRPFPGGVEHHARMDSELGNARRASANDLPTAQKATALRAGRVVDNRFERAHKRGLQFDAAGLLAIPGATPARYRRYRLQLPLVRIVGWMPCDRLKLPALSRKRRAPSTGHRVG